ncbi:LRP2-binding protein isoform X1 [Tachysurus fulvidraco]|uniref:LRP2-binding protein isoform X1 n=1 Tax=Tachysurus fulvidraco TaxID=1234273 RepID=UPI001FEFD2D5|nr:LRP2-binding protein isoform X1 [Tachysurus fulvidraco]
MMDYSDQTPHKTDKLQKIRTDKVFNAVLSVYENHAAFKSAGNSAECLVKKAEAGDTQACLLLGHLYYKEGHYTEAGAIFHGIKDREPQALYQLAVMYYDGLGMTADPSKAVDYMRRVAEWDTGSVRYTALYNLGRAYMQGYGVQASREEAEKYWLVAADNGNPNASVEAQSSLGLFYSSPEIQDLKKAFYWHSEACSNGSLESQGALGIMYLYGYGVSKDLLAAFYCLTDAATRGNVYAQGHLVAYYYQRKLYTRAALLAKRVCTYVDISAIANSTGCNPEYICKGIATGLFYYARCLQLGRGVTQNTENALHYYNKAALMNPEVFKDLQMALTYGRM